jgi:hypothetical protein
MVASIQTLRHQYPSPVTSSSVCSSWCHALRSATYCVGGALGLSLGHTERFPGEEELAVWLLEENPQLSVSEAEDYAWAIIDANEQEHFDRAWNILDQALSYPMKHESMKA